MNYEGLEILPPKLQGFNMYESPLFNELVTKIKPKTIIEVGTWLGGSAFTMCESIKKNDLNTKLYCVDTWLGAIEFIDETKKCLVDSQMKAERDLMLKNGYPQVYYQFLSNVIHTGNENIITPVPNTSAIASRYFKNNGIKAELTYIDGSHDDEDVYQDLCNYYPLTIDTIFGDDFKTFMEVELAVTRFCKERNISFQVRENNFWIINVL